MIRTLSKLKGRSLRELAHRGRQQARILAERAGIGRDVTWPSDDLLLDLYGEHQFLRTDDLVEYFQRREPRFYASFEDPASSVGALKELFPSAVPSILKRAESVLSGDFDLLGYKGLRYGSDIPDWHLDPVSGKRAPIRHRAYYKETDGHETGDKKVIWELNRHQYFVVLGQAYWLNQDETYTELVISHINDWIEKNPPKIGVNWLSSLEIAYRSVSWIWAYHFFRYSPRFDKNAVLTILRCLYVSARHIEHNLSTYSSPNTHLTGEALGLYVIGTFLRETQVGKKWREMGRQILFEALQFQIRDDGGYVEQSTQYHRYTADIYLTLLLLTEAEGVDADDGLKEKLRNMLEFLAYIAQPNGLTPLIGDDDGGRLHFLDDKDFADFRSTLAVGAVALKNGLLKFRAETPSPELLWLTGPNGLATYHSLKETKTDEASRAFRQSGIYVIRNEWEPRSDFFLFDCGEHGFLNGGHAHADALSFVASINGKPVFVDSGTYTYTVDLSARNEFRSSGSHNCLSVNGIGSAVPEGPFSWERWPDAKLCEWSSDHGPTVFRGSHNGFEHFGVRYCREFRFGAEQPALLVDSIETSTPNTFEISFILSPEIEAEIRGSEEVELREKGGNRPLLTIVTKVIEELSAAPGTWTIAPTQVSPRYGQLAATTKLVFTIVRNHDFSVENKFLVFPK